MHYSFFVVFDMWPRISGLTSSNSPWSPYSEPLPTYQLWESVYLIQHCTCITGETVSIENQRNRQAFDWQRVEHFFGVNGYPLSVKYQY